MSRTIRRAHRPFIALTLAFMLALTGQSMAVARGMPGPSGAMVLCTGTGPITVLTDEKGQPVERAHICPDCALSMFAPDTSARPEVIRVTAVTAVRFDLSGVTGQSRVALAAVARGPPVFF